MRSFLAPLSVGLMTAALLVGAPDAPAQSPATTQSLATLLEEAIEGDPRANRLIVGMKVVDLESNEVLYERKPQKLFVPASNMKLFTSAAALDFYGPDHRFTTRLSAEPASAETPETAPIHAILTGGGDPTFTNANLRAMIDEMIREHLPEGAVLHSHVRVDGSRFTAPLKGPGWMWDDEPAAYQMSVTAMMMDYNVATVRVDESEGHLSVTLDPPSPYPNVAISPEASAEGAVRVTREAFDDVFRIVPASGSFSPVRQRLSMHRPETWIAGVATMMFDEAGVPPTNVMQGKYRGIAERVEVVYRGRPLSEVIALFNKPSENAIGEMLVLNMAADHGRGASSWNAGTSLMGDWLVEQVGLERGSFRIADGSGLSRYNLITPEGTIQLLQHMWNHEHREAYVDSLPIAGVDGTMRGRLTGTPSGERRVIAKTGTMSGVSCLSGYVQTEEGNWLAFSLLTNGFVGPAGPVRAFQDRLCLIMVTGEDPEAN